MNGLAARSGVKLQQEISKDRSLLIPEYGRRIKDQTESEKNGLGLKADNENGIGIEIVNEEFSRCRKVFSSYIGFRIHQVKVCQKKTIQRRRLEN